MLGGTIDRELVEDLGGHVTHQLVNDLADRPGPGPVRGFLPDLSELPLPEQREGLLQDGGFRRKAAALDFLADESLPLFGERDIHKRCSWRSRIAWPRRPAKHG